MTQAGNLVVTATVLGITATVVLDLWSLGRKVLRGVAPPDYALVGRWFSYMARGQLRHESIAKAAPVRAERLIGWTMHYLIGVAFAFILLSSCGLEWLASPTLMPAMVVGVASVIAPFFLMQPGMGLGIAASRTPRPWAARMRSLTTHAVFGAALYLAGWVLHVLM